MLCHKGCYRTWTKVNGYPNIESTKEVEDDVSFIQNVLAQKIPLEEWEIGSLNFFRRYS